MQEWKKEKSTLNQQLTESLTNQQQLQVTAMQYQAAYTQVVTQYQTLQSSTGGATPPTEGAAPPGLQGVSVASEVPIVPVTTSGDTSESPQEDTGE